MSGLSDSAPVLNTQNVVEEKRESRVFGTISISSERPQLAGRILLALAMASGFALMIPSLTAGPLVLDEYGTYWIAGDGPLTLWQRSLDYENIPPLSPWLHRVFMDVLGESEWSFRFPSAIWYLLAIVFSYLLGREFRGPLPGGLCAIVTAWHPTALGEIGPARCYSLTLLLSAICFWAAVKWMKRPDDYRWTALWAIQSLALVWTHYLNFAVVLATLLVLGWRMYFRSVRGCVYLCVACLFLALSYCPLVAPCVRMANWGEYFGFQTEARILETVSAMWWIGLPVGWLAGKAAEHFRQSRTETEARKASRFGFIILLLWGLAPTVGAVIVCHGEYASLANARYRLGFDVAASCLLVTCLTNRLGTRASIVAVVAALVASWSVADRLPWQSKRLNDRQSFQWKELALHVQQHGTVGEPVFVQSGLGESFLIPALYEDQVILDYAACRLGRFYLKAEHPRFGLPFHWPLNRKLAVHYKNLLVRTPGEFHESVWGASATDTDLNQTSYLEFHSLLISMGYEAVKKIILPDAILFHYRFRKEE